MSDQPRILLVEVKAHIEKAFEGWISSLDDEETDDPENPGEEAKDLNFSHVRIMQFLKQYEQIESENARLTARCNRMVTTADIKDVEWRPAN